MRYPIIPPFPGVEPITRITPFTERAGSTFLKILEELAEYVSKMGETENAVHDELIANVNTAINTAIDTVNDAIRNAAEANDAAIADALARVQAAIDEVLNANISVNDAIVAQLVKNSESLTRAALDDVYVQTANAVRSVAGRTGEVELAPADVGAVTTPTNGTIPLRTAAGRLPGIGTPTSASEAAPKSYVDTTIRDSETVTGEAIDAAKADAKLARDADGVSITHRSKTINGLLCNVFTISTGGKHYPGMIGRRLADGAAPQLANFKTPLELAARDGDSFMSSGSGWDMTTGRIRGANIVDGVAHGALNKAHQQDNAAVAYCSDGKLRYYEAALGQTVNTMLADGALHSWSWGPALILNGVTHNYAASGGWGNLNTTAKSGRTVLAQRNNGDLVIFQIYGKSDAYGATVPETVAAIQGEGFAIAVLLDGGGTTQSVWDGKTAHATSDATARPIPDTITVNARRGNVMRHPKTEVPLASGYTGKLECELVDDRVRVTGVLQGKRATAGNDQITADNALPEYVRNTRSMAAIRFSGGRTGTFAVRASSSGHRNIIYLANGYSDGVSNPDIFADFPASLDVE